MNRKKLIVLTIIFMVISIISFYCAFKTDEITVDFADPAYSYLPESAKKFIEYEAKKGNIVLTEKNKEPNRVYLNPRYVEYLAMSESERSSLEVIPQVYTYDFVSTKKATANFESQYRIDNLTVKNQGSLGICWAFATYSAIETNIMKTGLSSTPVSFAERQIDYAMANALEEGNNPYSLAEVIDKMDNFYELSMTPHTLGSGSSFAEAYKYLSMGISPVSEEIWGEYNSSTRPRTINEVLNHDNVEYQVSSTVVYGDNIYNDPNYSNSSKREYMEQLKNHIMNYGSLYTVTVSPNWEAGSCYDESRNLIIYDEDDEDCKYGTNHALSIVGWDDNYAGVGAWILKNSWGSDNLPYVYMAYTSDFFDVSGVIKTDVKNWDNGYDFTKANTSSYTSNAYEITYYKSPDFKERLERISFTSWEINSTFKIYYKNGTGSYTLAKTVTVDLPGLVSVDFSNIILDKSSFSIKIITDTNGAIIDEGLNVFTSNYVNEKYLETYKFTNSVQNLSKQLIVRNVESGTNLNYYVYDSYGKNYIANKTAYVINGTVNINESLPSLPSGNYYLTLDDNFFDINVIKETELKVDNTYQIEYEVSDKLVVQSVSYTSSNPSVATVSDTGLVTALKTGKTTITLNINNNIEVQIVVTVFGDSTVDILKILDSDQTIYLSLIQEYELHLNINPGTYTKADVDWTTSNSSVATVSDGLVSFLGAGNVTITVSSGLLSDEIEFDVIDSTSSITLTSDKTTIEVGEQITLSHSSGTFRYRYSTSDNEVLSVRNNGIVTGLKNGSAWVYYGRGNDVAGIMINVIDPEENMTLEIDPNGGKYEDEVNKFDISGNSMQMITLIEPTYNLTLTLIDGEVGEDINITHTFKGYNLLGYGTLDGLNYTYGFGNGSLTALWEYQKYTLPVPEKENLIFVGWYTDPEFAELFGRDKTFTPKESMTLYAKFTDVRTGDINNDGEIDITDLVILRKGLAGLVELNEKESLAADINKDGNVDITDLVILRKYLAGLEEIE